MPHNWRHHEGSRQTGGKLNLPPRSLPDAYSEGLPNKPLNLTKSPLRWRAFERFLTGAFAG